MARRARKRVVFAKRVDHPGTRAQPYLEPAVKAAQEYMLQVLLPKAMDKVQKGGDLRKELATVVKKAAFYGLRYAQRLVPVDTAHLKRSLTAQERDALLWTIGTNVAYGLWVETGTRPHVILPRRKSVLRFTVKRPRVS